MPLNRWDVTDTILTVRFRAPTHPLSVNDVSHWAGKYGQCKAWRDVAHMLGLVLVRASRDWVPIQGAVRVTLPFPTRNSRDPHNYTGSTVKAVVDGLVKGGVFIDDTSDHVTVEDPVLTVDPVRVAAVRITPW